MYMKQVAQWQWRSGDVYLNLGVPVAVGPGSGTITLCDLEQGMAPLCKIKRTIVRLHLCTPVIFACTIRLIQSSKP